MTERDDARQGAAKVAAYDEFVDWNKRLAREAPLFRRVFDEVSARSVIDVGAGSARHAILFATWGLAVDAIDPDESMLEQAEANIAAYAGQIAEAGGAVRLQRGGFGELASLGLGPADALTCTGNALGHVEGRAGLRSTLEDFAAVLRPGGALVLHLLNHARLLDKRPRAIPPVVRVTPEGTKVFLRVISYAEDVGADNDALDFDFVTLVRSELDGEWSLSHRRSLHTALPRDVLESALQQADFGDVRVYGDHTGRELDVGNDESIIVVATRLQ